jgi:hypothetical protein
MFVMTTILKSKNLINLQCIITFLDRIFGHHYFFYEIDYFLHNKINISIKGSFEPSVFNNTQYTFSNEFCMKIYTLYLHIFKISPCFNKKMKLQILHFIFYLKY